MTSAFFVISNQYSIFKRRPYSFFFILSSFFMKNGTSSEVLLAFGFPQRHQVLMSLIPHVTIIEHHTPDCALAAAVSQSATGALLCSNKDLDALLTMSGRWHAHPATVARPLILMGCDHWKLEEAELANRLTADTYLPTTVTASVVMETIGRLNARFQGLAEMEPSKASILPTFNEKLETMLREQSMSQTVSITQMAHELGMSLSRFQRTVKRLTGRSPIDYMNYVRLSRARQLLATRSGTVSDVAYQCGFNSVAYFCKQFKREFGQTPGETMA
jgi:AraC-like DNA-binding protein